MSALILHHYDASPFTQKALRMLGLKGLEWQSVETPMIEPKPDLVTLTGGYRGTPVLQIGADIYIDSQRIARELEERFPDPTFYPAADRGLADALVTWGQAFFRVGLHMAIHATAADWPQAFRADREAVFPDIDFAQVLRDDDHERGQFLAHAAFLESALADGRSFLSGDAPGLADIQAFSVPWFARAGIPGVNDMLAAMPRLSAWEARVADLGEGRREVITAQAAIDVARAVIPDVSPAVIAPQASGFAAGDAVRVAPDDSQRGAMQGKLLRLDAHGISVLHDSDRAGAVVVHFPRLGYRLSRA